MILIDASVWIDHFRRPIARVAELVEIKDVVSHPLIVGEVAMGSLPKRRATLRAMSKLPKLAQASHAEVMALIEWEQLFSQGIGFIDAHLLASVRFTDGCMLWTRDKRLHAQAQRLGLAYRP